MPRVHVDTEDGERFYTLEDVLRLTPAEYTAWVYDLKTTRVDKVRLYRDKRLNAWLNSWPVWLPHAIWLPVALLLSFPLSWHRGAAMAAGAALWPLLEVCFHRFLFHVPVTNRVVQRMHIVMHGSHHLAPKDPGRLTSHPLMVAGYTSAIYFALRLCSAPHADAVIAGLLFSYLRTDATHAAVHLFSKKQLASVPGMGWFLVKCQRHHLRHHFQNPYDFYPISFYSPWREACLARRGERRVGEHARAFETNAAHAERNVA